MSYYGNRRYNPPREVYEVSGLIGWNTGPRPTPRTESDDEDTRREQRRDREDAQAASDNRKLNGWG